MAGEEGGFSRPPLEASIVAEIVEAGFRSSGVCVTSSKQASDAVEHPEPNTPQEQVKVKVRRKIRGNRKPRHASKKHKRVQQKHQKTNTGHGNIGMHWKLAYSSGQQPVNTRVDHDAPTESRDTRPHQAKLEVLGVAADKERKRPNLANTVIRVLVRINGVDVVVLIDSGASHDFMSKRLAKRLCLETVDAGEMHLKLGDGRSTEQTIRRTQSVLLTMNNWLEMREFHVIPNLTDELVLGKPWLTKWNPQVDWVNNRLRLYNEEIGMMSDIEAMHGDDEPTFQFISAAQANKELRAGHDAFIVWVLNTEMSETLGKCRINCKTGNQREQMQQLLRTNADCLPESVDALPPRRHIDHRIDLVPGAAPPHRKPFRLSQPQLVELKKVLQKLVEKGYIRPSVSPFGAPVFFVPKPDGSLRFICDWRQLNKITIKNKACIPNVEDLFDKVQGAKFFSHLDLHLGYNQVLIKDEDVHKTAIATPFGHFEWVVMGLGMTNAPATFQTLMNDVFRTLLFDFVVVFLDDILIFSNSFEEHLKHPTAEKV